MAWSGLAILSCLLHHSSAASIDYPEFMNKSCYGIWDRSGNNDRTSRPFLRGRAAKMTWADISPSKGTFQYADLRASLEGAASEDQCWYGMAHAGPDSPLWLYDEGVPEVAVAKDTDHNFRYPYYLDPKYKKFWYGMIRNVSAYLRSLPDDLVNRIAFWQVTTGCTGDEVAYKQEPKDPVYNIDTTTWDDFRIEAFGVFVEAFQQGPGRVIPLLFNAVDADEHPLMPPWIKENVVSGGIKGGALARLHHLSEEREWIETWRPYMLNPPLGHAPLITRAEMDQTFSDSPVWLINREMNFYWAIINGMNQALAVHDVTDTPIQECFAWNIASNYELFNKYAAQIYTALATDAFLVFHEGLDAEDPVKFAEDTFGTVVRRNGDVIKTPERLVAICAAYAQFGCGIDDLDAAMKGQVYQRGAQMGFNDVGWGLWNTNYMRHVEQIDADATSMGLWRVGGMITNSTPKYNRFARALNHSVGKTTMYFRMWDGFFNVTSPANSGTFTFSIIWLDNLAGSWQVQYVDTAGQTRTALNQISHGDYYWKKDGFVIRDGAWNRGGPRGSDFIINSKDSTDIIFHMIEINRDLVVVAQGAPAPTFQEQILAKAVPNSFKPTMAPGVSGSGQIPTQVPVPATRFSIDVGIVVAGSPQAYVADPANAMICRLAMGKTLDLPVGDIDVSFRVGNNSSRRLEQQQVLRRLAAVVVASYNITVPDTAMVASGITAARIGTALNTSSLPATLSTNLIAQHTAAGAPINVTSLVYVTSATKTSLTVLLPSAPTPAPAVDKVSKCCVVDASSAYVCAFLHFVAVGLL